MNIIEYSEGMTIKEPCFVANMPNEVYHAWPEGVSNSGLSLVARSPAHYAHRAAFKQTRHMEIGTAFHTALLEPDRYAKEYMIVEGINDRRKSEYKEAAKVYGPENTLTDNEGASVAVMLESVKSNPDAREVMEQDGYAELSAFARDPETGILLRSRFDWITTSGRCVDIKKTQDCREHSFQRSVHQYRYHCQDAMYSHVFELVAGHPIERYQFLAIEEQPPCANILWELDALAKRYGWMQYREALESYAAACKSGIWSGYQETSGLLALPEYVLMDMDEALESDMNYSEE